MNPLKTDRETEMNPSPSIIAALLMCLSLSPATFAQQAEAGQGQDEKLNLLSMSEVVLDQYAVMNVDPDELFDLARELTGRRIYMREHGGLRSAGVETMRLLGATVVLYDTREHVNVARELLEKLDVRTTHEYDSGNESREYRPRFVSLKTARDAVNRRVQRVSTLDERGILALQGTSEQLEEAEATLKRIDVPDRQVLVTCYLLEVSDEHHGPPLPEELVLNLRKLLPESHFSQVAMAMLKTSVTRPEPTSLQIQSPDELYELSFIPTAFDESTGSLTVSRCTLLQDMFASGQASRQLFTTNTVLRGGEYTVLAATGSTPKLLVVRITPQE
jgi:hypothetical protein